MKAKLSQEYMDFLMK